MRALHVFAVLLCAAPALAQNWYIPDNSLSTGGCNVIPFGQSPGGPFYQAKYQARVTSADLGGAPVVITGLAFAPCNAGRAHYDSLQIVMDHIPASQPLVNTFASNLTPAAVTVLSGTNYTWNVPANMWYEVGLQTLFVYNGVDDLVIEITSVNGTAPVQGMRSGSRQRLYWIAASGTPPATGTLGTSAALKMEISMMMARASSHGDGCLGSNGTPTLNFSGSPVVGNTLSFDLTNGVPSGVALFFAGFSNAAPFPFELSIIGMPGCYAYTDLTVTAALFLDPLGAGSFALPIPASVVGLLFYGQFAVLDPPANTFGFTTSNYGRVFTGN
jgi:hypothetical protein